MAFLVAACGLDVVGLAPGVTDGGASSSSSGANGGSSTSSTSSSSGSPAACDDSICRTFDPKWKPAAVAMGAAAATCPTGEIPEVLRTNPKAGADACACKAANPVPPVCNKGSVTFKTGSGGTCPNTGVVTTSSDASCHPVNGTLASSVSFEQLAPSGGSCTAEPSPDPSKVTSDAVTICAPACAADLCAKKAPEGFRACVVAEGDVACDLPGFTDKHLAGATTSLSCGACSGCTASATCTNVSIDLYTSSGCGTKVFNLPANACTSTGGASGDGIGGMIYNAVVTPTYTAPPSTGTANLVNAKTVCCAP